MIDPEIHLITKLIIKGRILQFGRFKLSNGLETPYYLDFTLLSSRIDLLKTLIDLVEKAIKRRLGLEKVGKYVGILEKGAVITIPLAFKNDVPFALVSAEDGRVKIGTLNTTDEILLIDDMISTGNTLVNVIKRLREEYGVEVRNVFVVLDREEGGMKRLKEMGLNVERLVGIREIIETLYKLDVVSQEEYGVVIEHLEKVGV